MAALVPEVVQTLAQLAAVVLVVLAAMIGSLQLVIHLTWFAYGFGFGDSPTIR